jgi:aspartyl aminopeptidase
MANDLSVARENIVTFELSLYDFQESRLVGIHQEFINSPRLDNLASSFAALDAIIEHKKKSPELRDHAEVDVIILFDHEEIGSKSAQGADSNLSVELTERIFKASMPTATQEDYYRSIRRSFMISADMAHAVHPNYSEKH